MAETQTPSIHEIELPMLNGKPASLGAFAGKVVLAVNTASKCGFTPQYGGLQALQDRYSEQSFTVLGFPCNQFFRQEPGSAEDIQNFCSDNYGVTFPMFAKLDVKGSKQHPLYAILSQFPDDRGKAGNVGWNFEKFLVDKDGHVVRRFRSKVEPQSAEVVKAIESLL
ncbi:MAG TPA: glutathione peroxidase [Candidatus Acidoferrum sp.]|jgi:glutathione peroxidase|nr:glutathione peroxidase [Candidatus Acidoferrum sp.]